jgi:predicted O-methyltransferase YrrM
MKLHKQIPAVKLYRKLRYRKGYGVHSPFVYSLITKVIEEKASFYAFDEIEKLRKEMLTVENPRIRLILKETQHRNYGALLFRIVNFFKCRTVLQIGGSCGIMSLYLAMASPKHCHCYVLEKRSGLWDRVKAFADVHALDGLYFMEGDYEKKLNVLSVILKQVDLLFINELPDYSDTEQVFAFCSPFIHAKTILVIHNIIKDKKMHTLWQKAKNHSRARVCLDLYALGIIFFDEKLPKKHYKTYFNYGKKQNLYKNWRRRLYIFGWRKKSTQNKLPY